MFQTPERVTLNMNQTVMSKFQDGSHGDVQCGKCQNIGENYEPPCIITQNIVDVVQ